MNLQITSGGLLAIASGGGETHAVRLTRIAIGSGRGPGGAGDADRVALRTPRDSAAVVAGDASNVARLTGSAAIAPTGSYAVSEVGVFGRPVQSNGLGDEILLAFWTHPTTASAAAVVGAAIVIAAAVDVRAGSASVSIAVPAQVSFPWPQSFMDLADTPDFLSLGLLRVAAGADAVEVAPAAEVAAQLAAAAPPRLLAYVAPGSVVGPAYACTWLICAWGAGGGGNAQDDTAARNPARPGGEVLPGAGTATKLSPPAPAVAVVAAMGGIPRSGRRTDVAWYAEAGGVNLGDLIVPGAGAAGGRGYKGAQGYDYHDVAGGWAGANGRPGDFAAAVVRPRSGVRYSVTIGAGGRGGVWKPTTLGGQAGAPGRLLIVEFR